MLFRAQQALLHMIGPSAFFARRAAAALYDAGSLAGRPELVERTVARMAGRRGADLADVLRAVVLDPPDTVGMLARITVPLALVAGDHDYVLPPRTRAAVEEAAPDARHDRGRRRLEPGGGPAAVTRALRDLLGDADRAGVARPGR